MGNRTKAVSKQTKPKGKQMMITKKIADVLMEAQQTEMEKQHSEIIARWRETDTKRQASVEAALTALDSIEEKARAERIVIIAEVKRLEALSKRSSDEEKALTQLTSGLDATKPIGLPKKFEDLKKQVEEQRKLYEAMFPSNWSDYFVKDGSKWRSINYGVLMKCTRLRQIKLPGNTVEETIDVVAQAFIGDSARKYSLRKDYYRTDVTLPSNIDEIADTVVALMTKWSRGT